MKHSSKEDLAMIADLIERVRNTGIVKEKTEFHFYYKNRGVLHFHTDSGKLYADVLDERICLGDIRSPDISAKEQVFSTLMKKFQQIDEVFPKHQSQNGSC